jgi:hypothetical protein
VILPYNCTPIASAAALNGKPAKPRLLFLRGEEMRGLTDFIHSHLRQQQKCLSLYFDIVTITGSCDYRKLCEEYQPDLTLFESGIYTSHLYSRPREISNTSAFPAIPKLGFLHSDPFCWSRIGFLSDMERWGIETYFTHSVSMAEYLPSIADKLFVWPNFIDSDIFFDYELPKVIPALITGSQAQLYPWRNRVAPAIAQYFPSLVCPHLGYHHVREVSRMVFDGEYARMINASYVVPTCGTIAKEIVRKHFEIPGCNSCLITEETPSLQAAGFVDLQNCVFATEDDVVDKLDYLFKNRDELERITRAGYSLVHSRHTIRQRGQIREWLDLYRSLRPTERIVQTGPFEPLVIVDESSSLKNRHCLSQGVDRQLLRLGHDALRNGDYERAEEMYLRCRNYYFMPEPILGLTICKLYKGGARSATECIVEYMKARVRTQGNKDLDPVEWAYFIRCLLCQGDLREATRRAHQFPFLRHRELDRCRSIIDALNGSTCEVINNGSGEDLGTKWRPSVHDLPERPFSDWVNDLCMMLKACQQGNLAEQISKVVSQGGVLTSFPSRPRRLKTPSRLRLRRSGQLWLSAQTFRQKVVRCIPWKVRVAKHRLAAVRSRMPSARFLDAVGACARQERADSALICGACYRSAYTRVFLDSIHANPSMPTAFCMASSQESLRGLERRYARNRQVKLVADCHRHELIMKRFDIIFIDGNLPNMEELMEPLTSATTVLIRDTNSNLGRKIARRLFACEYDLVDERVSSKSRYAIFRRRNSGERGCWGDPGAARVALPAEVESDGTGA